VEVHVVIQSLRSPEEQVPEHLVKSMRDCTLRQKSGMQFKDVQGVTGTLIPKRVSFAMAPAKRAVRRSTTSGTTRVLTDPTDPDSV